MSVAISVGFDNLMDESKLALASGARGKLSGRKAAVDAVRTTQGPDT
jgi:hypothetical protein